MSVQRTQSSPAPHTLRTTPLWQAWVDLSLRTKLLLFGLGLVTLPGALFAFVAFSGARGALEREVGIQLHQTAERGAEALATALERAQSDARSWAHQDLMRDLTVGDLDKRVSRFLRTVRDSKAAYLEVLCAEESGNVIAASDGKWIGRTVPGWERLLAARTGGESLVGPTPLAELGGEVLEIAIPIANPDAPGSHIGSLVLIYDWRGVQEILDGIRVKLAELDKSVGAIVVDREGNVIGGVAIDGQPASRTGPAAERWRELPASGYGKRVVRGSSDGPVELLVGAARVASSPEGWSVVFLERTTAALAPVREIRNRWGVMLTFILLAGLAAATLLARQVMRPLDEVTRATSEIASHPDLTFPLLPVRSRNEVGELAESFNKMTVELKRSHEEALAAAKFAFAGELAAMVAHEVRTPLSVMRSSAQMLADPTPSGTADHTELIETIVAEVDRVERVVTGLIQLARPLEQRLEPTRLCDVLARATDFVAAQARRQGVRITYDVADGARPALCDPDQIYQVVLNLLVNALQVLQPGGCIRVRALPAAGATVGFAIGDDGPGLPPELEGRIFQPFVTGRAGGTGLGLAFVERIVKAHRGSVAVRSDPGKGTVFEVRLPLAAEAV